MWNFQPHRFDPRREENLKLYHVYDSRFQMSYYIPDEGIGTRGHNINPMRYCFSRTDSSISTHINSSPSGLLRSVIPIFADRERAFKEAHRQMSNPLFWSGSGWHNRPDMRIAVIDANRLVAAGSFVFSASNLASERMMNLDGVGQELAGMVNRGGWFVMGGIPEAAVDHLVQVGSDVVMGDGVPCGPDTRESGWYSWRAVP